MFGLLDVHRGHPRPPARLCEQTVDRILECPESGGEGVLEIGKWMIFDHRHGSDKLSIQTAYYMRMLLSILFLHTSIAEQIDIFQLLNKEWPMPDQVVVHLEHGPHGQSSEHEENRQQD